MSTHPPKLSAADAQTGAQRRVYAYLIPIFGLLLLLGAAAMLGYLRHEMTQLQRNSAVQEAEHFSASITEFRNFYSAEIVPRARASGMEITHAYRQSPNALPLPATFALDFGEFLSRNREVSTVQLFSDLPFPWRSGQRPLDDFQTAALAALKAKPEQAFDRVETIAGQEVLRYAVADRMVASCVACHNSYPGSPRTDWKVGDVRGVLEVRRVLTDEATQLERGMRNAVLMAAGVVALGLLLVALTVRGLRASDARNRLLLAETAQANESLQREIGQRELVEDNLRFNEGKLRAIFDSILEGVIVIDRRGSIVQANRIACEMFGWQMSDLIAQNVASLMPGGQASQHDGHLASYLKTGEHSVIGRTRIFEGLRRDGSTFPMQLAVSEVRVGREVLFTGIISDISAQVAREDELRAARDAAIDSTRMKSEFLANMSHEIRTPMNGIIGMTDLALDTELNAEQREYISIVKASADSLLTIINDILDSSRIEAGKLLIESQPFALAPAMDETVRSLSTLARRKGLTLDLQLAPSLPATLVGDATRLRQVLINLIGNAIKFTETGSIRVTVDGEPAADDRFTLRFAVTDTGIGISADKTAYIFNPFAQEDASITRKFGGTGLGLSICQRLVALMGGSIAVDSEPGRGSTFRFSALLGMPPAASAARPVATGPAPATGTPDRLTVLLAEDNPVNQKLAQVLLGRMGYEVSVAVNGQLALERFMTGTFDAVLMDIQMPVMDGLEATRRIREWEQAQGRPRTPIIAMTANAMPRDRDTCLQAGMDEHITKPISRQELQTVLSAATAPGAAR
jgi:PAS domain S-box-containing protein